MATSDNNGVVLTVRGNEGASIMGPRNIPLVKPSNRRLP
jgi:hypothetical protein